MLGLIEWYGFLTERRFSLLECLLCIGLLGYTIYVWFSLKLRSIELKNKELWVIKNDFDLKLLKILDDLSSINIRIEESEDRLKELQLNDDDFNQNSSNEQTKTNENIHKKLKNIRIIDDESWLEFKTLFKTIYPEYYNYIVKDFSCDLTEGELRMIMLLKLNYNYNEMSDCLGISYESARIALYRLKKKMKFTGTASELNQMLLETFKNSRTY